MAKTSDMLLLYRFGAVRTLADAANVFAEDAMRAWRSRRRQRRQHVVGSFVRVAVLVDGRGRVYVEGPCVCVELPPPNGCDAFPLPKGAIERAGVLVSQETGDLIDLG